MQIIAGTTRDGRILADLINIACRDKRNFTPVTEQTLETLWSRNLAHANTGLLLATDDNGTLLGVTHALYDPDAQKGYLPFLLSRPGHEDRVWPLLLSASERYLDKASHVTIGSPYTPLYCALEGRFQPMWGTTETMEPAETDEKLIAFLKERGFRLQHTHLTMTRTKGTVPFVPPLVPLVLLQGAECWENHYDWYGSTALEEFGQPQFALNVLVAREDYQVIGHIAWYAMRQRGKAAICDLEVVKRHRRQGIGAYLVQSALMRLAESGFSEVELCTTPAVNTAAHRLYLRNGFMPVASWLEMSRRQRRDKRDGSSCKSHALS